jgi:hypothetical protein
MYVCTNLLLLLLLYNACNFHLQSRWINKQRLLVFASRGITYRDRHLMEDIRGMLAHARSDSKMEKKDNLTVINEVRLMYTEINDTQHTPNNLQ